MLKGQAKTDYQREYMREYQRSKRGSKQIDTRSKQIEAGLNNEPVRPTVPLYNSSIHHAGDRVLVRQGKRLVETVIPQYDADGYLMYED